MHRLRKAYGGSNPLFPGPVEADETFVGGKRSNMPKARRKELSGRGAVGKSVVAGMKDRGSNKVRANVVGDTSAGTLQGFVRDNAEPGAMVYTDEAGAYQGVSHGRVGTAMKRSSTALASMSGAWRIPMGSSRSGAC